MMFLREYNDDWVLHEVKIQYTGIQYKNIMTDLCLLSYINDYLRSHIGIVKKTLCSVPV
jgi:hypothetical protein